MHMHCLQGCYVLRAAARFYSCGRFFLPKFPKRYGTMNVGQTSTFHLRCETKCEMIERPPLNCVCSVKFTGKLEMRKTMLHNTRANLHSRLMPLTSHVSRILTSHSGDVENLPPNPAKRRLNNTRTIKYGLGDDHEMLNVPFLKFAIHASHLIFVT
eukprot:3543605-Amphidinium_carterae.1